MASAQGQQFLAERVDIHKSCKSLETLLNVLNDYCEAAGAVVLLQKKLAKALRETANLKVTGEIASNAMTASATIFDALSDIDSKFAKIADKEYDGISAEVKKWFKKLAKEEKAHDDRLSSANAKIKQAGLIYEKKSKKNPRDSADEHARYINLISSLGPEISQEKYNHTLQVTQRHTSTTYSVAACVSRVADAEWLRSCEGVRRFSPTIGPLGEWRALCEGGWTGPFPPPLVDPDPDPQPGQATQEVHTDDGTMRNLNPSDTSTPVQSYEREQTPSMSPLPSPTPPRPTLAHLQQSSPPSSFEPPRAFVDANSGSVRSLSAFPPPPTHFPIPSASSRQQQSSQQASSSSASNSNLNSPTTHQDESNLLEPNRQVEEPSSAPPSPNLTNAERKPTYADPAPVSLQRETLDIKRPIPVRSQTVESYQSNFDRIPSPAVSSSMRAYARGDYLVDDRDLKAHPDGPDMMKSKNGIERSDTGGSAGSVVAAMRNRYSSTSGATSPGPKDIPRLPLSVSDLATRYQPMDAGPVSPRGGGASSPPVLSSRTPLPASPDRFSAARQAETASGDRNPPGGYPAWVSPPMSSPSLSKSAAEDDAARRRNQREGRIDEVAELEFLEKEKALQDKEREIGMRAKELELERANLRSSQREAWDGTTSPIPQLRPRERKTSFRNPSPLPRPQSQLETRAPSTNVANNHAYSYSATHLIPPSSSSQPQSSSSPRSSTSSADGSRNTSQHAPYCGCESCSVTQYKSPSNRSPSPNDMRPPEKPFALRPEKPKGWIRRLSMPVAVGNAFSLDKKNTGKMYSLDGNKRGVNASATTLRNVDEDGRLGQGRRSYDASATSNRSMTSLIGAGRR
ncbi:hypothetical protein B0H17DRAFT_1033457 [Mycena rosella]|uniref:Uncharacterized protein n=1 Tax=Mycena rosella TaxID=1033263 RepID=A0AAD7MA22_MYCRO|nr:hypothetical protein B0H17DRAFT_1033457 [Mycena rosella]